MEVHIVSKQMIKPSYSRIRLLKPFKLSRFDQLSVPCYVPIILFYAKSSDPRFSDKLKESLSKALTQFYPLAGRTKNNLFVDDYDQGVPYVEARVKGKLFDFIERSREEIEEMNRLLPCRPYCTIQDFSVVPQMAVQVNVFDCGGIALALCSFHKIIDATTITAFLKSWTTFCRGDDDSPNGEIPNIPHDLLEAGSRLFPPIESVLPINTDMQLMQLTRLNQDRRRKTRCFVFDANAIATLKFKAKSSRLNHPSPGVAVGAFLWKHAIQASRSVSTIHKAAVLLQLVNLRPRMKPRLPDYSIGNLFCCSSTIYNPVEEDVELADLAYLVKESATNPEFKSVTEQPSVEILEMVSKGNAELFALNSWVHILDGEEDFGWGKASLFSTSGPENGSDESFINCFNLKRARQVNAIEAWVTLSEQGMGFMEQDLEFLSFASPTLFFHKVKL